MPGLLKMKKKFSVEFPLQQQNSAVESMQNGLHPEGQRNEEPHRERSQAALQSGNIIVY